MEKMFYNKSVWTKLSTEISFGEIVDLAMKLGPGPEPFIKAMHKRSFKKEVLDIFIKYHKGGYSFNSVCESFWTLIVCENTRENQIKALQSL